MLIKDLKEFIFVPTYRDIFIEGINGEVEKYEKCLKKGGASCPVELKGDDKFRVYEYNVVDIEKYLTERCSEAARDYVLTAVQLSENIIKTDDVFDLIDELTSS
ncbi:MAG: hypothetical protein K2W86_00330 [Sphingomonas sp.]|uniref:hypothetical protein n=1 Tax=Sphingomonas sp. TaxID=28214 RepID=UPI0035A996F8|nr:hypothetical protein [Sphingomonas sp.]